jgi:hypothetical protein
MKMAYCAKIFLAGTTPLKHFRKYEDFFVRNGTKTLHSVNLEYDLNLSLVTYMRLHEALAFYSRQYDNNEGPSQSLQFFIKTFDKGSKPFRRIYSMQKPVV